jgi:hypothetical protein
VTDDHLGFVARPVRDHGDASLPALDAGDPHPVPELGSRRRGLLGEEVVEPLALR